jgi:Asp-tRNA(Asn)/Glu-tRNA(Gln) amidotransferase A subunit family amidase
MSETREAALVQPADLVEVAQALRSGAPSLDAHLIETLERLDAVEPVVRAFVPEPRRRERLQRAYAELATSYPAPDERPPLFGVAVGVKDIFRVEGLAMRAGSALPPEEFAGEEASSVRRLREAGAVVLGKTVTTEFAYFEPGATTNPHNPRHGPGGSSSGSAAAVAAGETPLALGTQTVGSVIRPAAFCGVVGFKPTYGRIPVDGVLPFSPSVDTVGTFTASVAGAALAASVLCDGWTGVSEPAVAPVIGVPDDAYLAKADADARHDFELQLATLAGAGCRVVRVEALEDIDVIVQRHGRMNAAEFRHEHEERFARYGGLWRARSAMLFDLGATLPPDVIDEGRRGREELRQALAAHMDAHGIDVWASPAAPGGAPEGLGSTGDPVMNAPWTHAGTPVVTVPAGWSDGGLPLGLQLAGRFQGDEALLGAALFIEDELADRL